MNLLCFKKKVIKLSISKDDAVQILRRHIQHRFIRDTVHEDSFQLHVCVARTANRAFLTLYMKGTLVECEHGVKVSYAIRPTYLAILFSAVLFVTLLEGFLKLCINKGDILYLLIGLIINLVFHGSIIWQEHICLQRFESWLTI